MKEKNPSVIPKNGLVQIILFYKCQKGYKLSDKEWNKKYFGMFCKPAKTLLEYACNDLKIAKEAIIWTKMKCLNINVNWNLGTVLKQYPDFEQEYIDRTKLPPEPDAEKVAEEEKDYLVKNFTDEKKLADYFRKFAEDSEKKIKNNHT